MNVDGKSYLYDMVDLTEKKKVISSTSSTASNKRSEVFEPKPSFEDNVTQNQPNVNELGEASRQVLTNLPALFECRDVYPLPIVF